MSPPPSQLFGRSLPNSGKVLAAVRRACSQSPVTARFSKQFSRRIALIATSQVPVVLAMSSNNKAHASGGDPHDEVRQPPTQNPADEGTFRTPISDLEELQANIEAREQEAANELPDEEEERYRKPGAKRQYLVIMRHGERIDEIDKEWRVSADRPYDPYLTPKGIQQATSVADSLKQYDLKKIYVSPFLRCLQTTMYAAEGLGIAPENWTVSARVSEFLNPWIMVKKPAKLPPGNINTWFWQKGGMKEDMSLKLPPTIADKVNIGHTTFDRYPENLVNSRTRYIKAFQEVADQAGGENVLVVTHGDGVNASVGRMYPWAIVYPVLHTGYTVSWREELADGSWSKWHLQSKSGENGVWWNERLQPVYHVWRGGNSVFKGARSVVGKVFGGKVLTVLEGVFGAVFGAIFGVAWAILQTVLRPFSALLRALSGR